MNNPQYKTKETYRTTEHWEVWEVQVNKLKSYLSEIANNDYTFATKKEYKKEDVWQDKTNKRD